MTERGPGPVDVRRLAAVDLHGAAGSVLRRRVIITEFVLGTVGCVALGVVLLSFGSWVLALWVLGVAANYLPLAVHAVSMADPARLAEELDGVDLPRAIAHYTRTQFWVFVPFLLAVLALAQPRSAPVDHGDR